MLLKSHARLVARCNSKLGQNAKVKTEAFGVDAVNQSDSVKTQRTSDFKLLRYFSTASLLAFVVVSLLLGYIFRQLAIDSMLQGYEREHVNYAQVISNLMWEERFEPLMSKMAGKTSAQMQAEPEAVALHQKVQVLLKGTRIFKIKVYDLNGMTIYSSEQKQIGEDKSKNAGVMGALLGVSKSKLAHQNQFSTFEGEVQDRDVVESYVPRLDETTGKVRGVLEIYGDATDGLSEIGGRQWVILGSVVALLTLLYLVLFVIVKRAQDQIIVQSWERQKALQALALSEERWKFALEGSGDGVWDRNLATGDVVFSKRYKEIYGFAEDELENHSEVWDARVHPDDLALVVADRAAYFSGEKPHYASERRMQCKDGSWKWILSRGMVVARDAHGKPLRMIGTHSDISERHAREEELRLASTVFLTMDEAVTVTNAENEIVSVNPAFSVITGYFAHEVIGKNPRLLASGSHGADFYQEMWKQITNAGSWHGEIRNRRKSGEHYVEWLSIKKVCNPQGVLTHYVAVFSDISERKATEERMHRLAHFDVLTELPNRALVADRLQQAVARAQRDKRSMALMFIDLDKFKPVNDELGHHVGDLLLKQVARRLSACVQRESDTVGRIGGDEFVVLLTDIEAAPEAIRVAEKIRQALEQAFEIGPHLIRVASSIGIALYPQDGADQASLLKSADAAMYQAKENGGNRVHLFA